MNIYINTQKMISKQIGKDRFLSQSIDFNYKMLISACKFSTLYLLSQDLNNCEFLFEDPLQKKHRVKISKQISCSCHQGNLGHCIHSLYILIRIYKLSEEHPFIYKNSYTSQDIETLKSMKNKLGNSQTLKDQKSKYQSNEKIQKLRQQVQNLILSEEKQEKIQDKKIEDKKVEGEEWPTFEKDTVCSICYDQIENQNPIINCLGCKNYFHTKCLKVWVTQKQSLGETSSCPMCRSQFQDQINKRIIKMDKYYIQYHQSHGIPCSSCGKDILIKLYKCLMCQQIYLCSECYFKWEHKSHDRFIVKEGKRMDWAISERSEFNINKLNANLQYIRKFGGKNGQLKEIMGEKYEKFLENYIKKPTLVEHIVNSLLDVEKEAHKTYKKLDFVEKDIVCCMCRKKKIVGMRRLMCKHFVDEKCLKFLLQNKVRQCPIDKSYILPGLSGITLDLS